MLPRVRIALCLCPALVGPHSSGPALASPPHVMRFSSGRDTRRTLRANWTLRCPTGPPPCAYPSAVLCSGVNHSELSAPRASARRVGSAPAHLDDTRIARCAPPVGQPPAKLSRRNRRRRPGLSRSTERETLRTPCARAIRGKKRRRSPTVCTQPRAASVGPTSVRESGSAAREACCTPNKRRTGPLR